MIRRTLPLDEAKIDAFLITLSETGSVREACTRHSLARATVYKRRADDETFAAAWEAARDLAVEALEDEAHRRAMIGIKKNVYHKGEVVGTERIYSDYLLTLLLRANKEKYRDKRDINVSGSLALAERLEKARARAT